MNEFMTVIEWWVVPIILCLFLVYVLFLLPPDEAPALVKASSRSGKWAGLVILALFVVSRKESNDTFSFTIPTYPFDYLTTVIATLIGGGFYHAVTQLGTTRALGFFSFLLSAAVSMTLYSYFYIAAFRSSIVFCTLGVTLGILLQ
ncbi:MAG TPA: hypothetical protein PKO06_08070, partial [Candidatus Ozemobacteraceae bacterium]|nr:hypothetical protein [Candidatus Ozemobacteraceae bacterium]